MSPRTGAPRGPVGAPGGRVTTRTLGVRARVVPRPEPPFDRLFDPLTDQLVHGGPVARARFATLWSDTPALTALARAKRAPLPSTLAGELVSMHRRLGAGPASLAHLDRLARGEAVCAVAGQQPAPLGGPLYVLHKIAATVGLARVIEERTGVPCVPLFWMHGEDSDFEEIRTATIADTGLALHDLALPATMHPEGGLLGDLPLVPPGLETEALRRWEGLPGTTEVARLLERARGAARDLGEQFSALMLALFAEQGLVVVDPRLPAFRAAAHGVIDRYLAAASLLAAAARSAGDGLERQGFTRALNDPALESFVFALEDGGRQKIAPADARARGTSVTLTPSVALRPAVQDGVLPTVAMACGPGELAYLGQLREVFEGLGVAPACPVPRFSATWLPMSGAALAEAADAPVWEVVTAADAVLRRLAEARVPAEVRSELARVHADALAGLTRYAEAARTVDASLPQMVESARAKIDFQFQRLHEGVVAKVRHRLERQQPEWMRLRYVLMPGDRLQERRLASLQPLAHRGAAVVGEVCELATAHARALAGGVNEHAVVDL